LREDYQQRGDDIISAFKEKEASYNREIDTMERSLINYRQTTEQAIEETERRRLMAEQNCQETISHEKEKVDIQVKAYEEKSML
jgi:hypothetical protein